MSHTTKTVFKIIAILLFGFFCYVGGFAHGATAMYGKFHEDDVQQPDPGSEPQPEPQPEATPEGPLRPSWMRLTSPDMTTQIRYRMLDAEFWSQQHVLYSNVQPIQHEDSAARIYAARDRVLARAEPPSRFWRWTEIRHRVAEVGTSARPLWESNPFAEPAHCNAFFEAATGRLAFCEGGVSALSDFEVESMLIHEMTHAEVDESFATRAGLHPAEISDISMRCPDVAKEYFFGTEGAAFWNQSAYLLAYEGTQHGDAMINAATAVLRRPNDRGAARTFAHWLLFYINSPAELPRYRPGTPDCGMIVAVRGPNAGQFVLTMDILPQLVRIAELVPHFAK